MRNLIAVFFFFANIIFLPLANAEFRIDGFYEVYLSYPAPETYSIKFFPKQKITGQRIGGSLENHVKHYNQSEEFLRPFNYSKSNSRLIFAQELNGLIVTNGVALKNGHFDNYIFHETKDGAIISSTKIINYFQNRKIGAIEPKSGKVVLEQIYYSITKVNGIYIAHKENGYDFVKDDGTIINSVNHQYISSNFREGFSSFYDSITQLWGYIDYQGAVKVPAMYKALTPFNNGIAGVKFKNNEWYYINTLNEKLRGPFKEIADTTGLKDIDINKNAEDGWNVSKRSGEIIQKSVEKFTILGSRDSGNMVLRTIDYDKVQKFFRNSGEIISDFDLQVINPEATNGIFVVRAKTGNQQYFLINSKTGQPLSPEMYDALSPLSHKYYVASRGNGKDRRLFILDKFGKQIISPINALRVPYSEDGDTYRIGDLLFFENFTKSEPYSFERLEELMYKLPKIKNKEYQHAASCCNQMLLSKHKLYKVHQKGNDVMMIGLMNQNEELILPIVFKEIDGPFLVNNIRSYIVKAKNNKLTIIHEPPHVSTGVEYSTLTPVHINGRDLDYFLYEK